MFLWSSPVTVLWCNTNTAYIVWRSGAALGPRWPAWWNHECSTCSFKEEQNQVRLRGLFCYAGRLVWRLWMKCEFRLEIRWKQSLWCHYRVSGLQISKPQQCGKRAWHFVCFPVIPCLHTSRNSFVRNPMVKLKLWASLYDACVDLNFVRQAHECTMKCGTSGAPEVYNSKNLSKSSGSDY